MDSNQFDKIKVSRDSRITITKKNGGVRFSFQKNKFGILQFYGKKHKQLTVFDRFLSDIYEKAIKTLISIKDTIPQNVKFNVYIENRKLILTNIFKDGVNLDGEDNLKIYAEILGIDFQKELYDGFINDELLEALKTNDLKYLEKTFGDNTIFKIRNGKKVILHKLKLKETIRNKSETHAFELTVANILEYLSNVDVFNILVHHSDNSEIRFIDLVLKIFSSYINEYENNVKFPNFLKNAGRINKKYLTNENVKEYIYNNKDNEYLLKIFMIVAMGRLKKHGFIEEKDVLNSQLIFSFLKKYSDSRGLMEQRNLKKIYE